MHRLAVLILTVLLGLSSVGMALAGEAAPLRVGIMPFNSALALLRTHQPLREHLQRSLKRPVELYTSNDYFTYLNEALEQRFDILIAGPHFGVMAVDKGYLPLFRYRAMLQPLLVVRADAPIASVADLRGKRIGLSSRLSISSIGGARWLQEQGLQMGRDYPIFERATHGAAIAAVAVGELDAALTTHTPLNQVPPDIRARVRILPTEIQVSHLMTLAHGRLGKVDVERIRTALRAFSEESAEGRKFFAETGYLGYEPVTPSDIANLKPYVELTRKMMGVAD
jgi:phosphonate transport system substrate-binding protein